MPIYVDGGANPGRIVYDGTDLTRVVYDGTTVWERVRTATWKDAGGLGYEVTGTNHYYDGCVGSALPPMEDYALKLPSIQLPGESTTFELQPAAGSPSWKRKSSTLGSDDIPYTAYYTDGTSHSGTSKIMLAFYFNSPGVLTVDYYPPLVLSKQVSRVVTSAGTYTLKTYLYEEG